MRIRRAMKKMLGTATVYPLFLGEKWDDGSAGNGSLEVCQLNQSPWDVASTDLDLFTAACSQSFESAVNSREEAQPVEKEEEEEEADKAIIEKSEGILVNSTMKSENKTEPIRPCKRAKESTDKSERSEMKEMVVASEGDILCKKNDGKKWFCKRPAQLPHRFCEFHIRAKPNPKPKPEPKRKKPKREKNKDITSSSSFFYYYEGFGPWRGKRRGETEETTHDHMKEEEEEQESNKKDQEDRYIEEPHDNPNKKDVKIMDGRDLPIAGLLDEDYDYEEIVASSSKGNEEKKVGKKRGRKPLKCRSLKSLM